MFDNDSNAFGEIRKFIGGCPHFPFFLDEELSKGEQDWSKEDQRGFISPSEIASRFRSIIEPKVQEAIEIDVRFLCFDIQCCLCKAFEQLNRDRLDAAYSVIVSYGRPVSSRDLAKQVFGLPIHAPGFQLAHFSLNYSLAQDSRFRNVGRPGYPEWTTSRSVTRPAPTAPRTRAILHKATVMKQCPFCHEKQVDENKRCKCGADLVKLEKSQKVRYFSR
jgi:hypothetical protein